MNLSKFIVTFIFIAITAFCSNLTAANINGLVAKIETQSTKKDVTTKVDGGPRTVIQFMTSVEVLQPEATNLYITILDPNGAVHSNLTSDEVQTVISTEGWAAGEYVVQTVDDENVYQEATVTIN